jgi:hypothetical protein
MLGSFARRASDAEDEVEVVVGDLDVAPDGPRAAAPQGGGRLPGIRLIVKRN